MNQAVTLLDLLSKLKASRSPLSHMKRLSELWKFVAGLSREERLQLAKTIGLEQSEDLLERFVASPGTQASRMTKWTDTILGSLDGRKVEQLVRQNMESHEAAALVSALRMFGLKGAKTAPPPQPGPEIPSVTSGPERGKVSPAAETLGKLESRPLPELKSKPVDLSPVIKPEPPPDTPKRPGDREVEKEELRVAAGPLPEANSISKSVPAPLITSTSISTDTNAPGSQPSLPRAEAPQPSRSVPREQDVVGAHFQPAKAPQTLSDLQSELETVESETTRYRILKRRLRSADCSLSLQDAASLISSFGPNWMRRRLLVELLLVVDPIGVEDLVELLEDQIPGPWDYLWTLSRVHQDLSLTESDQETLLQHAPSPLIRKLLRNRFASIR